MELWETELTIMRYRRQTLETIECWIHRRWTLKHMLSFTNIVSLPNPHKDFGKVNDWFILPSFPISFCLPVYPSTGYATAGIRAVCIDVCATVWNALYTSRKKWCSSASIFRVSVHCVIISRGEWDWKIYGSIPLSASPLCRARASTPVFY